MDSDHLPGVNARSRDFMVTIRTNVIPAVEKPTAASPASPSLRTARSTRRSDDDRQVEAASLGATTPLGVALDEHFRRNHGYLGSNPQPESLPATRQQADFGTRDQVPPELGRARRDLLALRRELHVNDAAPHGDRPRSGSPIPTFPGALATAVTTTTCSEGHAGSGPFPNLR